MPCTFIDNDNMGFIYNIFIYLFFFFTFKQRHLNNTPFVIINIIILLRSNSRTTTFYERLDIIPKRFCIKVLGIILLSKCN